MFNFPELIQKLEKVIQVCLRWFVLQRKSPPYGLRSSIYTYRLGATGPELKRKNHIQYSEYSTVETGIPTYYFMTSARSKIDESIEARVQS